MPIVERTVTVPEHSLLSPPLAAALRLLRRAETTARRAGSPLWDFAVDIHSLTALGLTTSDLRYLVRLGHVEHAVETSRPSDTSRRFRRWDNLCFRKRTCFVLTARGAELVAVPEARKPDILLAASLLPHSPVNECVEVLGGGRAAGRPAYDAAAEHLAVPSWDGDRKIVRIGGHLVKQFKVPSPNQEAILAAFEEEGWPPGIDDPLPPKADMEQKRRLRATIQSLNAHHKKNLLRFRGDGSGERVLWEAVARPARLSAFPAQQVRAV